MFYNICLFGKQFGSTSKSNMELLHNFHDPTISIPRYTPTELKTYVLMKTYTLMFIAALFIIAKK